MMAAKKAKSSKGTKVAKAKTSNRVVSTKGAKTRVSQSHRAQQIVAAFLGLAKEYGFEVLPKKPSRGGRIVPASFIEGACSAWDKHGTATGMKTFDSNGARESIAHRAAFADAVDTGTLVARRLEHTIMTPYRQQCRQALALYKVMSAQATVEGNEALVPDVAKLAKILSTGPRAAKVAPKAV